MRITCGQTEDSRHLTREGIAAGIALRPAQTVMREGYRAAAVLVPFVCVDGDWHFLLTRRTEDLEHHRGQISFPGGGADSGESAIETAVREAREEIALDGANVEILGVVDQIWTPSRFIISPVVGIVRTLDGLAPNPSEVSRVFTVPVAFFADERNAEIRTVHVNGFTRDVYHYHHGGETIWGATAFIIRGILDRLRGARAI